VLPVTGGTYFRTYYNPGTGPVNGTESDKATVSTFGLDKYDVTVGRFRAFVAAWNGGWRPAAGSGKHAHLNGGQGLVNVAVSQTTYEPGWDVSYDSNIDTSDQARACYSGYQTWTSSASTQENLPINCVSWYEAYAFCIWDGAGFLPSEAEWIYAAASSQQLEYPWGSADPGTANQYAIYNCLYPTGSTMCTGVASIAPVGTATSGVGPFGQLDLFGNLAQWNLDAHADPYVNPCTDCSYLGTAELMHHGGNFLAATLSNTQDRTGYVPPSFRGYPLGFRCARSP
jgi:formylglycine-generating enzyme required for sulfatase activity